MITDVESPVFTKTFQCRIKVVPLSRVDVSVRLSLRAMVGSVRVMAVVGVRVLMALMLMGMRHDCRQLWMMAR